MKLAQNCSDCGKNEFKEVRTEKLGNVDHVICRCVFCGAEVRLELTLSLRQSLEKERSLDKRNDYGMEM